MPEITGLHYVVLVVLSVRDIRKSAAWYIELLGDSDNTQLGFYVRKSCGRAPDAGRATTGSSARRSSRPTG